MGFVGLADLRASSINNFKSRLSPLICVRLSETLWNSVQDVFNSILKHPFIEGLATGSLEEERFKHYIIQDYIYLDEYRKALSLAAAKAGGEEESMLFLESAANIKNAEEQLHESFLTAWRLRPRLLRRKSEVSPSNLLYTSYLFSVALFGSFNEIVAAVLPCAWVYMEVGRRLVERGSPNPLYKKWIDMYGGRRYEESVEKMIGLADTLKPSRAEREKMVRHFRLGTIFEYMFWDSAYRLEKFPFPVEPEKTG